MKVNFINQYSLNRNPLNNSPHDKRQTASYNVPFTKIPVGYMSYPIAFGGSAKVANSDKLSKFIISKLQILPDMPCIYCGGRMIPRTASNALSWKTEVTSSAKSFLGIVSEMKIILTPYEKDILERLRNENIDVPQAPLSELLQKVGYKKSKNFDRIINEELSPIEYNKRAIDIIIKYEDYLFPVEKNVLEEIKNYRETNPEATLQEIMLALRPKHLKTLEQNQMKVLNEIELLAKNLPSGIKDRVLSSTTAARHAIFNDNSEAPFKRKKLIASLNELKKNLPNNIFISKIQEKTLEFPNSNNNVSAFIIKYSGKVKVKEQLETYTTRTKSIKEKSVSNNTRDINRPKFEQRSDREIGQSLLKKATYTIEHIKTQESYINPNDPEMNSIANWALAHDFCNGVRDCLDLDKHLKNKPEILKNNNPQKQIDVIIENINNNTLQGCDIYPSLLKKTEYKESKGLINLDISKLKISEPFILN